MRNFLKLVLATVATTGISAANAAGTDYTALTSAVDFSQVGTALVAIGGIIMMPKVVKWGTNKVLSMVRG